MSQTTLGGLTGGLGVLPQFRATLVRIRSTVQRPQYLTQAQRIEVNDPQGVTELRFIARFTMGAGSAELYGFYRGEDLEAVMSVSYDSTTSKYIFSVARNTWDALTVKFDTGVIGSTPTFPAVGAEGVVSLGYVTVSGVAA